jgi:siroheme synthase-like protein
VLCNIVDVPALCDFYYSAVVQRGALQIAISTAGQSPSLAQRLRKELEEQFGPEYARWLEHLGETRDRLFSEPMDPEQRKRRLHDLASKEAFEAFRRNGKDWSALRELYLTQANSTRSTRLESRFSIHEMRSSAYSKFPESVSLKA